MLTKRLSTAVALAGTVLVVSVVVALGAQQRSNSTPSIVGVWKLSETTTTGPNAKKVTSPQPGLRIYTRQHYSLTTVTSDKPRPELPEKGATDKQLADAFGDTRLGSPHNEVLRLFAEEGLIGGIALIAFIVALFRELSRRPGWIGSGLLAGAIGYWLAAMFNNPLLFIQVSATSFVFFGYGLAAPVPAEEAIPPAATPPNEAVSPALETA